MNLIKEITRLYEDNVSSFGTNASLNFDFKQQIKNAVKWYNGPLCRSYRASYNSSSHHRYNQKIPDLLFHGTAYEFLSSILSEGLVPNDNEVFLTDNILIASIYANQSVHKAKVNKYPLILIVDVRWLKNKLTPKLGCFYDPKYMTVSDYPIFPHWEFVYDKVIRRKRIAGDFVPPFYKQTVSMLISILKSIPDITPEEEFELDYLKKI